MAGGALGRQPEAEDALLRDAHAVVAPAVVRDDRSGALVEQVVAAHLLGVLVADPHRAELAADLLVDDDHDEQVAPRGTPALAGERQRRRDLGRGLRLHVQRAAAPHEAVVDVARPRVVRPVGRGREDRVHVREQAQRRPVARAAQARDEVRALGLGAQKLDFEARFAQLGRDHLLRRALVAGRVDGVEADQPLEELGRLLLQVRHRRDASGRCRAARRAAHAFGASRPAPSRHEREWRPATLRHVARSLSPLSIADITEPTPE